MRPVFLFCTIFNSIENDIILQVTPMYNFTVWFNHEFWTEMNICLCAADFTNKPFGQSKCLYAWTPNQCDFTASFQVLLFSVVFPGGLIQARVGEKLQWKISVNCIPGRVVPGESITLLSSLWFHSVSHSSVGHFAGDRPTSDADLHVHLVDAVG